MGDLARLRELFQPEVNYDDEDLFERLGLVAGHLDQHGRSAFTYGAFGTRHAMLVFDARLLCEDIEDIDCKLWVGMPPDGIGHPGDDRYTLWLRGGPGNAYAGPWLVKGSEHVPPYIQEKFDLNDIDGFGLGVAVLIIEASRADARLSREQIEDRIKTWKHHTEERVGERQIELPKVLGGKGYR